ncbi:hypothetical protein [Nitrosospira sp. NRS527]|uniref:hypothetical protein n=1 Tax=Nitrosospira sp. NRS527 TaxID=155925 RepID=UPI001AF04972|nr:hypothetical protein [Nitrosospira sp. NRS527]BCT67378.1 hypothetical protein NNRS527_00960 [Nitrosospira sp. NRS527]
MTYSTPLPWPPDADAAAARFLTRHYGSARADLDVDFCATPRASVVTGLLALCLQQTDGRNIDAATLWEWGVAARLQGLLAIAHATTGPITTAVATCNHADCGERIELELALENFALTAGESINWRTPLQQQASIRLPTGSDQLAWYAHSRDRRGVDAAWLARRLIMRLDATVPAAGWQLPAAWLAPLGAALDSADPLTALNITAHCPACDAQFEVEVDLEYLLLEDLRRQQRTLLDDIHQIAGSYHWSEADILALPSWRRAGYLSRIHAQSRAHS